MQPLNQVRETGIQAQRYQWHSSRNGSGHLKNKTDRQRYDNRARDHQHAINAADVLFGADALTDGYGTGGLSHDFLLELCARPVCLQPPGLVSVVPTQEQNRCFHGNRVIHSSLAIGPNCARDT
jgi:hypothetical protein